MNLDALLQPGALPWSPNPGVSGLDVWNAYEQPLAGTFLSGAQPVLFTIIADYEGRMSLWAYTCLTGDEARDLAKAEFDSVPEMREFVAGIFHGRKVALALAADNQIRQWSVPDEPGDIRDLAASFINQIVTAAGQSQDRSTELRVKLAQAAAATDELIDA